MAAGALFSSKPLARPLCPTTPWAGRALLFLAHPRMRQRKRSKQVKLISTQSGELNRLTVIVYGDTGVGKTTSLKTLPVDKTFIGVGERGAIPLKDQAYPAMIFREWDDLRELLGLFLHPDEIKDPKTKKAIETTRILVIDSLSEISDLCIKQIIQVDRRALTKERTKNQSDKPDKIYEDQMTIEDWGIYKTRMLNLISAFCHLDVHVIFTCRANWPNDKNGNPTMRTPGLSGKAAIECGAHVGLLLHMEAAKDSEGKDVRMWQTFKTDAVLAKDESGKLDPFEETNWMTVFEKIIGTKKQEKK